MKGLIFLVATAAFVGVSTGLQCFACNGAMTDHHNDCSGDPSRGSMVAIHKDCNDCATTIITHTDEHMMKHVNVTRYCTKPESPCTPMDSEYFGIHYQTMCCQEDMCNGMNVESMTVSGAGAARKEAFVAFFTTVMLFLGAHMF